MATDAGFGYNGFTPYRHFAGGVIRMNAYQILTSSTTGFNDNIFSGDLVARNADGTIETFSAGDGSATAPTLLGVFAGCQFVDSSGTVWFKPNWVASTACLTGSKITAWVYDDPMTTFLATTTRNAESGVASAQLDIGINADHVVGTGSALTGQSGSYVNMVSGTGTATAALRILAYPDIPNNTLGLSGCRVEVMLNEHVYRLGIGT